MIEIREERQEDFYAVGIINDRAFGTPEEGQVVRDVRSYRGTKNTETSGT